MKQTTVGIIRFRLSLMAFAAPALALALASSPLLAQAVLAEREGRTMRIGIIGVELAGAEHVPRGPPTGLSSELPLLRG